MPRHYPAELRRRTCERMLAGEAVKDLSAELGIHSVTLYKWRRQELIDAGTDPAMAPFTTVHESTQPGVANVRALLSAL